MSETLITVLITATVSSIVSGVISLTQKKTLSKIEKKIESDQAERKALQALLRDRLYQLYGYCAEEKKYASIRDRENFINMYENYHTLYKNGVMDDLKEKFLSLPIK